MRLLIIVFVLCGFISFGVCISFRKTAEIPSGAMDKAFGFDTDHDGKQNLVLSFNGIQFWEHIGFDRYILEDTATPSCLCDIGSSDSDSLTDMVGNINGLWPYPIYVYESATYNSNPTIIVWQDSGFMNIGNSYITDLDQDGLKEILFGYSPIEPPRWRTCVYENIGDNQYSLVWQDTTYAIWSAINGDFDLDGQTEFIAGSGGSGWVWVWECVGNNHYQVVFRDTLPWPNNTDVFSAHDMDGNGKPEFLFTSVDYFHGRAWLYLYETIGDNNYDFFLVDSITGIPGSMFYQTSICGDIDADGREEIVWSTFNQWHIYKAIGIHQYQKIYSSAWTLHDYKVMNVCDLNGNGYPEVIEAWSQNGIPSIEGTTIWEIEGVHIIQPNYGYILHPGEDYQIAWQRFNPPGADSFALFFSFDNGNTYDTIALGIPGSDTTYQWIVPNVISDSCKIMIWAYGPPRPGEQRPRGIVWDFGDFKIRPGSDVAETQYRPAYYNLRISPNPVRNENLRIQYSVPKSSKVRLAIYNTLGQLEEMLVDKEIAPGIYEIGLINPLTDGVYFVKLTTDGKIITKKCVILKN